MAYKSISNIKCCINNMLWHFSDPICADTYLPKSLWHNVLSAYPVGDLNIAVTRCAGMC